MRWLQHAFLFLYRPDVERRLHFLYWIFWSTIHRLGYSLHFNLQFLPLDCIVSCDAGDVICLASCARQLDLNKELCPCQSDCPNGCPCPNYQCSESTTPRPTTQTTASDTRKDTVLVLNTHDWQKNQERTSIFSELNWSCFKSVLSQYLLMQVAVAIKCSCLCLKRTPRFGKVVQHYGEIRLVFYFRQFMTGAV